MDADAKPTSDLANEALELESVRQGDEVGFPVVGVGASAGGLAAFARLLTEIPPTTGMAFVLIQHLDPSHESQLARILAKDSSLPVCEATDGLRLEPDRVYVIPPNTLMGMSGDRLVLSPREQVRGPHLSIDHFFRSLAHACGRRALGVLLTGTGSDGTLGLSEIKAAGGITFAQDPKFAEQQEMPRSAIAYGCVDFILSEQEIAREIGVVGRHPYLSSAQTAKASDPFAQDEGSYEKILAKLSGLANVNFTNYRASTIKRRILRRMAMRSIMSLDEYVTLLSHNGTEVDLLLKDVLINVTNFFRDDQVFAAIKESVCPELAKDRSADSAIRIWVVGCSTGQEAYSLAIAFIEYFDDKPIRPLIQIFATDISEPSLIKARSGTYPDSIQGEVSPERLHRHFTKVAEGYRVNKSIRDICVFAKHDVVADTPFSKIDLVSCRNMLIYLSPALQMRVLPIFHYALNAPGFLLLGNSETTGRSADLFTAVDQKQRIYGKNHDARRVHPMSFPPTPAKEFSAQNKPAAVPSSSLAELQRAADRFVLARYVPPGVLIDSKLNVIQFRGNSGDVLDHSQGEASLNLLKMVPYSLAQVIKKAVEEARERNAGVDRLGVRFHDQNGPREIDIRVNPIRPHGVQEGCMLIIFDQPRSKPTDPDRAPQAAPPPADPTDDLAVHELKWELATAKQDLATANEYLQSLAEENSTVTDELKYVNDEAHSKNEELRCSNEELQTAKEEVESANEELATLNDELRNRNTDLTVLSNDLTNLLDSIDLPVVMLGEDLRMRRMTVAAENILHLVSTDIGRPADSLGLVFNGPDLTQLVTEVLETRQAKELEIQNRQGHWYTLRINPYRIEGNQACGAVVSLIDIDAAKGTEKGLTELAEFSKAIVEASCYPLAVLTHDLRVQTANRAFCRLFDLSRDEVVGRPVYELNKGQWDIPELRSLLNNIADTGALFDDFEVSRNFPGIGQRNILLNARCLEGDNLPERMIVLAISDVTELKRLNRDLRETSAELLRSNAELDHFAAVASHDLQEPMRMIRNYGDLLVKKCDKRLDEAGQQYLAFMVDGAKRMQQLIKSILDYSRAGHHPIKCEQVDTAAAVGAAKLNLDRAISRAGATITCGPLPTIVGDEIQLTQLFQNLFSNALKFRSPDRPCLIGISARESDADWTFSIADNGIGIRPEDFERIFTLFQRLNAPSEYPGTGIGLATCKKIVERHGGRIWLASTVEAGTTFHVQLPKTARYSASRS